MLTKKWEKSEGGRNTYNQIPQQTEISAKIH